MNLEEYKNKLEALKARHKKEIKALDVDYATENNPVKIGDVITDHIGSIVVEKIVPWSIGIDREPMCVYSGTCYTKKGKPYKSGKKRWMYQENLKKINGCVILH